MALRAAAYLVCLIALATTAGCGMKGPLYLSTPKQLEREAERKEQLRKRQEREAEQESAEREQRQTY
jgi:predicted small lipoprotein YifL